MNLRSKLVSVILAASLIPLIFNGMFIYERFKYQLLAQTRERLTEVASLQKKSIDENYDNMMSVLESAANDESLKAYIQALLKSKDEQYLKDADFKLETLRQAFTGIIEMSVYNSDGFVIASTNHNNIGKLHDKKECIEFGLHNCGISNISKGRNNQNVLHMVCPFKLNNDVLTVIGIEWDLNLVFNFSNEYVTMGRSWESIIAMRDKDGGALFLSPLRFDKDAPLKRTINKSHTYTPIIHALNKEDGFWSDTVDYRGVPVWSVSRYLERTDWGLVVKIDKDEVVEPLSMLKFIIIFTIVIIASIMILVTYLLAANIVKPLKHLMASMNGVGTGDLTYKISVKASDETGELAEKFNRMVDNLAVMRKELHESEERYRGIFNETSVAIMLVDAETTEIVDVNQYACSYYGYTREEFLTKSIQDISALSKDEIKERHISTRDHKRHYFLSRHRLANGSIRDVEVHTGMVLLKGLRYIFSIIHDITEQRRIELNNLAIIESSIDGYWQVDTDGHIVDVNDAYSRMVGYSRQELLKMSIHDLAIVDDEDIKIRFKRHWKDGHERFESRHRTKDERIIDLEISSSLQKETGHVIAFFRDITERKRMEKELLESKKRMEDILESISDGFFVLDREWRYTYLNKNAAGLVYRTFEDLIGKCILDEYPEIVNTSYYANYNYVMTTGIQRQFEDYYPAMDSWFEGTIYPHPDGIAVFFRNVTQRKRMEKELEELNKDLQKRVDDEVGKNREKDKIMYEHARYADLGELLVNIAHQWRQPLAAISGIAQEILDSYEHNELTHAYLIKTVMDILSETLAMSAVIDSFKSFYRDDHSITFFKLAWAVERSLKFMEGWFRTHDIAIDAEMDETIEITGYTNEFSTAVLNILTNSRDIFEERNIVKGRIDIRLYKDSIKGRVVLIISDNGGGIDEDIIPKIFDPYFTTKHKARGVGLGLYTARTIIERNLAGSIDVKNIEKGVEFRIELAEGSRGKAEPSPC